MHRATMRRQCLSDMMIAVVLSIIGFGSLLPIWNAVAISLSDRVSAGLGYVSFWPHNINLSSYKEIFSSNRYFHAFFVSVVRVVLGGTLNVVLCIFMAYPLSKTARVFPCRNIYMWVFVFTMLFSGGLVPTYLVIRNLGLLDTIWALVLPGAVPVYSMILLMNFYKGIPASLEEAAFIDGAGPLYVLCKVFVPLSKASIATIALFAIVGHWNAFFDGKIYIHSMKNQPLQTYIQSLTVDIDPNNFSNLGPEEMARKLKVSSITFNAAKIIVSMIPILVIYPFLQRFFVKGIVLGAVKE